MNRARTRSLGVALVIATGCAALVASIAQEEPVRPPEGTPPERVVRRLAQIAVTVAGKEGTIRGLAARDFELMIGGRTIEGIVVDDLCRETVARPEGQAEARAPFPVGLVFYFDQNQMSPEGRHNALQTARDLARELVASGNRAMVVSAAQRMRFFADWSTDPEAVVAAIDAIEADPTQAGTDVVQEATKVERIRVALAQEAQHAALVSQSMSNLSRSPDLPSETGQQFSNAPRDLSGRVSREEADKATFRKMVDIDAQTRNSNAAASDEIAQSGRDSVISLARGFQLEERERARGSIERLTALLARISEAPAPKAVLYFADALRQNPGEHYLRVAGGDASSVGRSRRTPQGGDNFAAGNIISPAVERAASVGVRFYSVQAEGLVALTSREDTGRVRDAQGALTALAAETGGRAFLNGAASSKIAGEIESDLSCGYLISFDPRSLPEDAPLPVTVKVKASGASVRHPGLFVAEGEARLRSGRLLAAALDAPATGEGGIVGGLVPLDYDGRRYQALAQIAAPPTRDPDWDLGVTIVSDGILGEQFARRVAAPGATAPAVLETEVNVAPGAVTMTALALDRAQDRAGSYRADLVWPDPDAALASLTPVALLQPVDAAFVRGDTTRTRGSRVLTEGEPVAKGKPVAFVALVCRAGDGPRTLKVERTLRGETAVPFAAFDADLRDRRCAQIRDVIPADTLGSGGFVYAVRALEGDDQVASVERRFSAN